MQTEVQRVCELASRLPYPIAVDILTDMLLRMDRKLKDIEK